MVARCTADRIIMPFKGILDQMEDFRSIIQIHIFGIPPGLLVSASYPPPEPLLMSNVAWPNQLIMLRRTGWSQNQRALTAVDTAYNVAWTCGIRTLPNMAIVNCPEQRVCSDHRHPPGNPYYMPREHLIIWIPCPNSVVKRMRSIYEFFEPPDHPTVLALADRGERGTQT